MLNQKQLHDVKRLLSDLQDLQVSAHRLESSQAKGRKVDENDQDIAQAIETLRLGQLQISKSLSKYFDRESFEKIAEKYSKAYKFDPANVLLYIKEMIKDMAELYAKAFKLMLENMERAKRQENAEKAAEQSNKLAEAEHNKVPLTNSVSKPKTATNDLMTRRVLEPLKRPSLAVKGLASKGLRKPVETKNNKQRFTVKIEEYKSPKRRRTVQPKTKNGKSNIVYVKTSEAKAKDLANQRALKKQDMQMTKSAPAMAPAQMSR